MEVTWRSRPLWSTCYHYFTEDSFVILCSQLIFFNSSRTFSYFDQTCKMHFIVLKSYPNVAVFCFVWYCPLSSTSDSSVRSSSVYTHIYFIIILYSVVPLYLNKDQNPVESFSRSPLSVSSLWGRFNLVIGQFVGCCSPSLISGREKDKARWDATAIWWFKREGMGEGRIVHKSLTEVIRRVSFLFSLPQVDFCSAVARFFLSLSLLLEWKRRRCLRLQPVIVAFASELKRKEQEFN